MPRSFALLLAQPRIFAASAMGDISVWTTGTLAFERMLPAQNAAIQVRRAARAAGV